MSDPADLEDSTRPSTSTVSNRGWGVAGLHPDRRPIKIISVTMSQGLGMEFLMQFEGVDRIDTLVPSAIAKLHCPQLVIEFYEKHCEFPPNVVVNPGR